MNTPGLLVVLTLEQAEALMALVDKVVDELDWELEAVEFDAYAKLADAVDEV